MGLKSESEVQQRIQLEAAKHGIILMRNNMGAGKFIDEKSGQQSYVRFGLNNLSKEQNENTKSSDLVGIWRGRGLFVAIECKKEGWKFNPNDKREVAQLAFINFIKTHDGIAGFASSVDDFLELIKQ